MRLEQHCYQLAVYSQMLSREVLFDVGEDKNPEFLYFYVTRPSSADIDFSKISRQLSLGKTTRRG